MSGRWPFETLVLGDPSIGGQATVTLVAPMVDDPQSLLEQYDLSMHSFAALGNCGGLGGDVLSPQHSVAMLAQDKPQLLADSVSWTFDKLAIDPRSLSVLFNLLEGCDSQPLSARVFVDSSSSRTNVELGTFPPLTPHLAFDLEYELVTRNMELEVLFPGTIDLQAADRVLEALLSWRLVGFLGGFRRTELHPLESNFFPGDEPTLDEDTIVMSLEKSTADIAAFDSLINTLVWVAGLVTPIEKVTLI